MEKFYSLQNDKVYISEIEINKSRFLGFSKYVFDVEEAKKFVEDIKKKYNDARHVVYAYVIDGIQKSTDDGEPSGTAGRPILELLKHLNCNHIVCVVVRYFGGTKLGTGGLLRAYQNSVSECISKNLALYSRGRLFKGVFDYTEFKDFENSLRLRKVNIKKLEYKQKIELELVCFDNLNIENMQDFGEVFDVWEEKCK